MKLDVFNQSNSELIINNKTLPSPSFFMISNLGGGGSDKYRETVYLDLFENTPCLYNYHYLSNPKFAQKWISKINEYPSFGDFINFTRDSMINVEKFFSNEYKFNNYDATKTVYLLDSGAANIINDLLKTIDLETDSSLFNSELIKIMKEYYNYADRFKFDIVIGFDIGGKYTSKGEERSNEDIISGNIKVKQQSSVINNLLLEESIKYIQSKDCFYPKIFATVHGATPNEYLDSIDHILYLEKKYNFKFDGFALGGIASSKSLNKADWNIDTNTISTIKSLTKGTGIKDEVFNAIIASFACRIVKNRIGDRPIHALGAGGKMNIIPLYYSGATSFDCQTPGRRAYDGNESSTEQIFDSNAKNSFSQYLVATINKDLDLINTNIKNTYTKLNLIKDTTTPCGCPACNDFSINDIKTLYSRKKDSNEYYYLSRQLLNAHGIWQHNFLCKLAHKNTETTILSNFTQNQILLNILKYILFDFNYTIN